MTAGSTFPDITVRMLGGGTTNLSATSNDSNWKLVLVYRGKHCPLCAKQLAELKDHMADFTAAGVDVIAVSTDSAEMQELGLFVSDPMSDAEADRPFSEPGLFIINEDGNTQFTAISNAPILRPEFASVLMGIGFVRNPDNAYSLNRAASARSTKNEFTQWAPSQLLPRFARIAADHH